MKKITFVVGIMGNGGAERVISVLSNIFAAKGYQIYVITIYGEKTDYELNPSVVHISFKCKSRMRVFRPLERCIFLRNYYKTKKPDIVISFLADVNIYSLIAALFTKTKVIVSERNDPNQDPKSNMIRKLRNIVYWFADGLVYQTPDAKKYFEYLDKKKNAIIPNPIKDNLPNPYQGVRKNKIVTACRLDYQKNLIMMIDAFDMLQKKHEGYKLMIYGEGPLRNELENYILKKGLNTKVFLKGFSNNIHYEILKSKIFAISSDYEGISNSMLEALALGLPVIATDCPIGGTRMFIKNEINGVLVNVGDADAMAEAMIRIVEDDAFAKKLSVNAVNIREKLSAVIIANMWLDFINKIIPI
ncbi:MAG: putative glycosyltransferase [Sedimentibacter sp.]|jgi:glycosyltransferase involved in cell wall biosynthesis|nr:putative glycosyltransferase [Sedimentibacter sp.]